MVWALELLKKMGRAFELPKNRAEPSFSKHVAREPNFEPSLGSTQPNILHKCENRQEIYVKFFLCCVEKCTYSNILDFI